ncbi:MAG: YgiQ family radical SAM protein [Clostridiales bacterium]|jgi:uncharacterized radical SAM protein YgiQ|nr:YgiQ family radical SAM protein [Clostridiales bacterium]
MAFMPVCLSELKEKGIDRPDFVLVTGDAYVDHPSFGAAIIGRVLEKHGYSVGMIAQPDWNNDDSFAVFGKPRYGFFVAGGNIDSMVCHYTVAKKKRTKDFYSPGGAFGLRPDRAPVVYANKIRALYKDSPIILGGIEASLRRLAHYDYWTDAVRRSLLMDAGADLISYGMGEHQTVEIAEALASGLPIEEITFIRGTVYKTKDIDRAGDCIVLPSYAEVKAEKKKYAESFRLQYENTDAITAQPLAEAYGAVWIIQNPPSPPLSESELDAVYALKYMRRPHPMYDEKGGVPAIDEVKFSITANRGCFGGCAFCALTFHQGRAVTSRSHPSILTEAADMTFDPEFKGYIHDVGGPTANFRKAACARQLEKGVCKHKNCMTPEPCKNLIVDHTEYLSLLRKLRQIPKIKKVFIRSGIRYDYLIIDKNTRFFEELCRYHVSGQLKVAPEHVADAVLSKMGKPGRKVYDRFVKKYTQINEALGMNQFLVPYLMSSHPGSDLAAAVALAEYLRDNHLHPEQVQDFYPTPGTLSTCMSHTGIDPMTGESVYVPKNAREKAMQRALIQYKLPQNYALVREALLKAGRQDLIGFGKECLIRPRTAAGRDRKPAPKPESKKPIKKKTIRNIHKKKHGG